MAVPRARISKQRRNKRRSSHWKLALPGLVKCPKCGEPVLSHSKSLLTSVLQLRHSHALFSAFCILLLLFFSLCVVNIATCTVT